MVHINTPIARDTEEEMSEGQKRYSKKFDEWFFENEEDIF